MPSPRLRRPVRPFRHERFSSNCSAAETLEDLFLVVGGISRASERRWRMIFDNSELSWAWRIEKEGNNGVKYFVTEKRPGAPRHEYQMIDDAAPKRATLHAESKTASLDEVLSPAANHPLNPPYQWNRSRIVVRGQIVEHWLNDRLVLIYEHGSAAVAAGIARSKFAKFPDFGQTLRGHIMLTDHGTKRGSAPSSFASYPTPDRCNQRTLIEPLDRMVVDYSQLPTPSP